MSLPPDNKPALSQPDTARRPMPSRRSTLEYFNSYRAGDRFWRMFSSREKVIENIKTFAWVVPITIVIWIYAEREQIVVTTVSGIPVQVVSSDQSRYVEIVGNIEPTVSLKMTGPQQAFERVRERLVSGIPRGLRLDIDSRLGVGSNQTINIVDEIQNTEPFKSSGVTVEDSSPKEIAVNVDNLIRRELPVEIPPGIDNLTAETRFDPAKVWVVGPEKVLNYQLQHGLQVFADLAGNSAVKKEGTQAISSVPLVFSSPQEKLRIDPPVQVKATIVAKASDVQYEIDNVPVVLQIEPSSLRAFDVTVTTENIPKIIVTGPPEKIDDIKQGRSKPEAILKLGPEDAKTSSKALIYNLPAGVKVSEVDGMTSVDYTLTRKQGF